MRTILKLLVLCFSVQVLTCCTNDEGENDLDFIMPEEEEQAVTLDQKEAETF